MPNHRLHQTTRKKVYRASTPWSDDPVVELGVVLPESSAAMHDEDEHAIPAANIGDTNLISLAKTNPEAAEEIARLEDLMNRGAETKEEFLRLCQLLFDVGSVAVSEDLLRRNLDGYEGHA